MRLGMDNKSKNKNLNSGYVCKKVGPSGFASYNGQPLTTERSTAPAPKTKSGACGRRAIFVFNWVRSETAGCILIDMQDIDIFLDLLYNND